MRISDWSSDVCSSDLNVEQGLSVDLGEGRLRGAERQFLGVELRDRDRQVGILDHRAFVLERDPAHREAVADAVEAAARQADLGMFVGDVADRVRSEEHTSELQSLMRISYAVFCLKKK